MRHLIPALILSALFTTTAKAQGPAVSLRNFEEYCNYYPQLLKDSIVAKKVCKIMTEHKAAIALLANDSTLTVSEKQTRLFALLKNRKEKLSELLTGKQLEMIGGY